MRTYWLISQSPDHRSQQSSVVVVNEAAPDLISNVDSESFTSSSVALHPLINHWYMKHLQRGGSYCSNNANQYRPRYAQTSCCSCETKYIYNRRSDDNVTVDTIPERKQQIDKTNTVCNNSYLCVCRLNSSVLQMSSNQRGPRSAPVITFRL